MSNVFEEKNIYKAILNMGLPAMLGSLATLIYNLVDMYFVSLTRDSRQIAAVTLSTPILLIIMSLACIFGMGGSSVCARLIGEGRKKDTADCFNFCAWAIVLCSLITMVIGLVFTTQIANLAGADESNLIYTKAYLTWIFIGTPFIMIQNGLTHTFRSVALIKEATIGIVIGNAVNIVLDWLFIVPMGMGTTGAAMATSIGFTCGSLYYLICAIGQQQKKNEFVSLFPAKLRIEGKIFGDVVKIGIPGAMITVMLSVSNIVLNNFIAIYGSDAVASYGIAYKIDMFPIMLSVGLSQGSAPLLGYYFGKRDDHRLHTAMRIAALYEIILGALFTIGIFLLSRPLAGIFMHEEGLLSMTALFLRLLCFHAPFLGIINVVTAYFQALGKAGNSLFITLCRNIVLFIPGAVLMNHFFGLNGVILNQLVVEVILTVLCLVLYAANLPKKLIHLQTAAVN